MSTASPSRDMRWLILTIAALVVALDRATKLWIVSHLQLGQAIVIIPRVFRLTHVLNTGAAFSMFEGSTSPNLVRNVLIGFSVIAVVVVLVLIWKMGRVLSLTSVALALILGGAVGNLFGSLTWSTSLKCTSSTTTGQTSTWQTRQLSWEPACFSLRCYDHKGVHKPYGDR